MQILPIDKIQVDPTEIQMIDDIMKSTFRMITFSREHLADDLLNNYLRRTTNLRELLSIKNAQMEAQNEEEAHAYLLSLKKTLSYIMHEIKNQINFGTTIQLFHLFRSISPEAHVNHPNRYRDNLVQIGAYVCPDPGEISSLVSQVFHNMGRIKNTVIKAIYFHHEMIRIHPFIDGNGRTTRMAKNWLLMYDLYPPIFIRDESEKQEYIETLSKSFHEMNRHSPKWNAYVQDFFYQEIRRLRTNAQLIFESVKNLGEQRRKKGDKIE